MKNDGDVSSIEIRRKFLKTSFPMIIHFKIVFSSVAAIVNVMAVMLKKLGIGNKLVI